jgi:hypothetical protein
MADHRVGPLTKDDLQYPYPDGPSAGDDPRMRRIPDSVLLNRNEWYEMLYFINKFANDNASGRPGVAEKAERLIHKHLPSELRSREHVAKWLVDHWDAYGDSPL